MIYFLDEYLLAKNSSVEHAALKRLALFKQFKQPVKILTRDYDRLSVQTLRELGVAQTDVRNMFDYFQHVPADRPEKAVHNDEINLPTMDEVSVDANQSQVTNGDRLRRQVGYIPGTVGHVYYQNFLDDQGNLVECDLWDARGFKSATQYFGQDGLLAFERYYDLRGVPVLDIYYAGDHAGQFQISRIVLKGQTLKEDHEFDTLGELFSYFLDQLATEDSETTIFISDRPGIGVQPLLAMHAAAKKFVYIPINHVLTPGKPRQGELDVFIQPVLQHPQKVDGLIVQTPQQQHDLHDRFPKVRVAAIPAVTFDPALTARSVAAAASKKILFVGRLSPDKQLDQLLRAVALASRQVSGVTLDLFGYGDEQYQTAMRQLADRLEIGSQVTFKGYQSSLADQYPQYALLVNTNLTDGGPLALVEAQTHGLPVVSYRFSYGPSACVIDQETGYLIKQGRVNDLAEAIVRLLKRPEQSQQFGDHARALAQKQLAPEKVYARWQAFLGLDS